MTIGTVAAGLPLVGAVAEPGRALEFQRHGAAYGRKLYSDRSPRGFRRFLGCRIVRQRGHRFDGWPGTSFNNAFAEAVSGIARVSNTSGPQAAFLASSQSLLYVPGSASQIADVPAWVAMVGCGPWPWR